tara:strand:+ start:696 stop:1112 length:417 start_codon:yes stop_codon:yes gene_type:complete
MEFYPFLVAAHVTAVVFLVGGMLALDRMVVAVARSPQDQQAGTLTALARFDRQVVTPALLLAWIFGITLAVWAEWFPSTWLMVKLAVVVAVSAFHGLQSGRLRRSARAGTLAEGMTGAGAGLVLAMLIIAILAIAKPI